MGGKKLICDPNNIGNSEIPRATWNVDSADFGDIDFAISPAHVTVSKKFFENVHRRKRFIIVDERL